MALALPLPPAGAGDHRPRPLPSARPALRAVPPVARRRRRPTARAVAAYGSGLTLGFLLAAAASVPGGDALVAGQLELAGASAAVTGLAALRGRAVARRRRGGRRR